MNETHVAAAEAYYKAMSNKDLSGMGQYLHPNIQFIGPLATITGKGVVLEGAKGILLLFKSLTLRAKFGSGDQVMVVYDLDCSMPIGVLHVAALLTFKDALIARIELFYDARVFERKKDATASQQ